MLTALLTGGSAGIGRAIAQSLLATGHRVVSLDVNPPTLEHEQFHHRHVDLLSAAETHDVALEVAEAFRPTILVHNAGLVRPALLPDVNRVDLDALVSLHLGAAITLVQATLPAMREDGWGRVVLVSSRAALGLSTRTSYSATKAGMIGMARTWALELAPSGITVNVIAPGPIAGTKMFHDVVPEGSERERRLAASIPVRRIGRPEDVARAVMFFCDPQAGFVTGQTMFVCGGASVSSMAI
jgi:NAD(P)-dependent dehydrogenase (short-subunit alcohol dehydrogenase family)